MTIFVIVRGGVIVEAYEDEVEAEKAVAKLYASLPKGVDINIKVKPIYLVREEKCCK